MRPIFIFLSFGSTRVYRHQYLKDRNLCLTYGMAAVGRMLKLHRLINKHNVQFSVASTSAITSHRQRQEAERKNFFVTRRLDIWTF